MKEPNINELELNLLSETENVKLEALEALTVLSGDKTCKTLLINNPLILKSLVSIIQSQDKVIILKVCKILVNLAAEEDNATLIGDRSSDLITSLCDLLISTEELEISAAVSRIIMQLSFSNKNCIIMCDNAINLLTVLSNVILESLTATRLKNEDTAAFNSIICTSICIGLQNLSSLHENLITMGLISSGVFQALIEAIKVLNGPALIAACSAMQNLSLSPENIIKIGNLDSGLLQALVHVITTDKDEASYMACCTIMNLAIDDTIATLMCSQELGLLQALSKFAEENFGEVSNLIILHFIYFKFLAILFDSYI